MRIVAANVQLSSAHLFEARQTVSERTTVRIGPRAEECCGHRDRFDRGNGAGDEIDQLQRLLRKLFRKSAEGKDTERLERKIDALVERIEARGGDDAPTFRFAVDYRRRETYRETEATSFRASGSVTTDDGRQIDFAQALDLARVYARTEAISLRATGTFQPGSSSPAPLPGPTTGTGEASVATTPTAGTTAPESAPATQPALSLGGSVLGLDADGDGTIDPQTELVGQSGNGFAELAQYDEDRNGFIDEGDSVFSRLALVDRTAEGLTAATLTEKGVGAIYTASVATPHTYTDAGNRPVAQLARSGVYLNENGTTGIAQQVNVLV
ncbi:MAG: hypothetical protein SFV24_23430 [Gemmatimonadales bacterium]|nr:hypothetical protein [Gemmatimonadales bacterium]